MTKLKEIRDGIAAANKVFMASYDGADWPRLTSLYTRDGQIMPPNSKIATGAKARERLFQSFRKEGDLAIKLKTVEASGASNIAYEDGRYTLYDKAGKVTDRGKYIVVWKKVGGQWKLYRDIFNSNMPPPPPPK
jgi:ketosteroid isomerase-like protein